MELKIRINNRDLAYKAEKNSGRSLDELIGFIGGKYGKIKSVSLEGETKSYTFMRQVYLFLNICKFFSNCKVIINGTAVKGNFVAPDYTKTGCEFKGEN